MAGPTSDDDFGSAPTQTPAEGPDPAPSRSAGFRTVVAGHALLGRYEVADELGEGGMATVFRARDRELRRDVAIKVLFPHLARRADVVRRFHREARAAAGLEHPNILRVYDVGGGTEPGGDPPFIVMELVRGSSLKDEIDARGPLLAELCACAGALLADALAVAHAAGVIHRDVKPANVMVAPGGRLLLADFGVAHIDDDDSVVTRTGALLGTPAFMAPEQATGADVDVRSDVYSLGATLYQIATGVLPYSGPAPRVLAQIAAGELIAPARRRPAVGRELSRVIERMMAADPDRRPATAAAAASELRALVADGGFGEPADELAGYFADPPAFVAQRTATVVSALIDNARRARADGKIPRALALVDRASALAPDDPAITTLVDELSGRRRRAIGIATVAVVALGAGVAIAWQATRGDDAAVVATAVHDAAIAVAVPDAAAIAIVVDPIDAAAPAAAIDGAPAIVSRRADASPRSVPRDATIAIAPQIDAPVAVATATPDAALRASRVKLVMDSWCNVRIDGVDHGRADPARAIDVTPGAHDIVCTKGDGLPTWRQRVVVAAGETRVVKGTLLAATEVSLGIKRGDRAVIDGTSYARGARVDLVPGRHKVEVYDGKTLVVRTWVSVPRVDRCELRELTTSDGALSVDCFH